MGDSSSGGKTYFLNCEMLVLAQNCCHFPDLTGVKSDLYSVGRLNQVLSFLIYHYFDLTEISIDRPQQ